jgi:hypothetical protein
VVAAIFLVRAGGRFALGLAFDFDRACFRATDFLFILIAAFFGRLFAADLARRNFALISPFALAAFFPFGLRTILSSPHWVHDLQGYWVKCKVASSNRRAR